MAVTVLSGTSGALYYKPAGTTGTFGESGVNIGTDTITTETYLNLKVGDPVEFSVVNSQTGRWFRHPSCRSVAGNYLLRH